MPQQKRETIEYEFDDLRRNTDPVPNLVLAQLGIDTDGDDGRQEGKKRREAARRKERGEDDGSTDDHDDRDVLDDQDLDADDDVTLSRKELSRRLTDTRRRAERKASKEVQEARAEAADVIGKLSKRIDNVERTGKASDIDAEFGPKIADLEQQIETAMEAGNSKTVIQLNKQLADLMADRKIKIHQATNPTKGADADDEETTARTKSKIPARAQKWINRQDWWDDPDESHVRAYLHKVDRDLLKEGYDPEEDEYYAKLEARVEKKFPGVITPTVKKRRARDDDEDEEDDDDDRGRSRRRDDDDDDDDDRDDRSERTRSRQRGAARRSPVSEGDRGGASRGKDGDGGRRRRNGEVTLSRAQVANMRAFGLDPDNKAHVEEYTLEVQRQERADRR